MNDVEELQGLESACRLCLTTDETRSSIFGAVPTLVPLVDKIQSCVSVEVSTELFISIFSHIACQFIHFT